MLFYGIPGERRASTRPNMSSRQRKSTGGRTSRAQKQPNIFGSLKKLERKSSVAFDGGSAVVDLDKDDPVIMTTINGYTILVIFLAFVYLSLHTLITVHSSTSMWALKACCLWTTTPPPPWILWVHHRPLLHGPQLLRSELRRP